MKIELIEEIEHGRPSPWYKIEIDGRYVYGTWLKSESEALYEQVKKNPKMFDKQSNILKSEEIVVTL